MRNKLARAGILATALLGLASAPTVAGSTDLPCKHGCDVHVGDYRGKNDQGKAVELHVSRGHLDFGSHKEGAHYISKFKTEFVVTCNGVKSNVYINSTHRGHINGVRGHMHMGERYMETLWAPGGEITGFARYKNPSCTGISHFTLHRVGG